MELPVPQIAASTSGPIPDPPMPATTMARGRPGLITGERSTSEQTRTADLTCAADEAT